MTKYNFLVYHAQYAEFLEKLRDEGVLHISTIERGSEAYETLRDKYALQMKVEKIVDSCANMNKERGGAAKYVQEEVTIERGMQLIADYDKLSAEIEIQQQTLAAAEREVARMQVWGKYNPEDIKRLENYGYIVGFYACQAKNYKEEWEKDYNALVVNGGSNIVYFFTVTNDVITDIDAEVFVMSEQSSEQLQNTVAAEQLNVEYKRKAVSDFAAHNEDTFRQLLLVLQDDLNIDKVYLNTQKVADDKVMVLEGFCPDDKRDTLDGMLEKEGVYFQTEEPTEEDNVPIKLRNNWFTKLFEPLTGMYGMPSYQEWDPTPVLAPFFLLFFAMCMGDGGYGILLILFGLGVKFNKIKIDMFDGMGNIITTLGVSTLVVGFFLGTAFGINMAEADYVPQVLKNVMITGEIAGFNIQMVLAVAIGVVHICLAITLKAILYTKRFGFAKNISTWGWLLLILGSLVTIVLALVEMLSLDAAQIVLIVIGSISALGIYVFNDPKRNPLINIGAGLWDTYNMATGLLGDVLSYIRLYALGLAGGMLGGAFNTLGLMVLGDEPSILMWIPFILILILGHLLNLAMSVLGAFVHPLRLTFVEYFKNSGYEGKGEKYDPLVKRVNLTNN